MGVLGDIRDGKRSCSDFGAGAIFAWPLLLGGSGVAVGAASERGMIAFGTIGALVGLAIGLYAAFGDSMLARVLVLPGALLTLLTWFGN